MSARSFLAFDVNLRSRKFYENLKVLPNKNSKTYMGVFRGSVTYWISNNNNFNGKTNKLKVH
jgi:hypothetical protein